MMRAFCLHATQLDPLQTASASPDELTRLLPRGLYTTFSTNHNGTRVLGLTAHLDRLYAPAQEAAPSASRADLRLVLAQLAADEAPGESRFRLIRSAADGTLYIIVQPFSLRIFPVRMSMVWLLEKKTVTFKVTVLEGHDSVETH